MKLICDEPAEHLKINSTSSQYRQLFKGSSSSNHSLEFTSCEPTTEEDTEDELKAPLLSINERLNEIYVSGGERRRPLKDWATSDCPQQQQHNLNLTGRRPRHKFCPFPSRRDINHRLSIWDGDIRLLEVDAISTTATASGETLLGGQQQQQQPQQQQQSKQQQNWEQSGSSEDRVLRRSGVAQVRRALSEGSGYDTCEVQVTPPGFQLSAKYILHTVCPVLGEKYRTATQTTLYSSYRNVLTKAVDLGIKSVAVCTGYASSQKHFPLDIAAHIALRTVRRFLETHPEFRIVLCVDKSERSLYNRLTPLYFPASKAEEEAAIWHLPADIGGVLGEPVDPERQIRIIQNPQHDAMDRADDESDTSPHDLEGGNADLEYGSVLLNVNNHQSFTQMQGDLDRQRLLGDRPRAGVYESVVEDGLEGIEHQERYEKLLKRAQTEDLREVSGIGCLYQSGVDRLGRPVIVFCGKWFPAQNVNLEKALLYLIYLLDPIVNGDYVITYFHTLTSSSNYPSLHWLKDVYTVLPYKYKKHLKAFYIVHPTIWTKMVTWWFTTFMAPAIKAKVHSLPGVEHLYSAISKDQLEIPAYITEYDMTVNGLHYFQPTGPTTSS